LSQVESGEIRVKRRKDGKVVFGFLAAAEYNECSLTRSGGQCLYFEAHAGQRISCIEDLKRYKPEHPNVRLVPTAATVDAVETTVADRLPGEAIEGERESF
jgi:hypothetical protein